MRLIVERLPKNLLAFVIRGALTSWVGPNNTMYQAGAILVGHAGKRIANEDSDKLMARAAAAERRTPPSWSSTPGGKEVLCLAEPCSTFPGVAYAYVEDYKRYRPDVYHRADTIEELAQSTGLDPAVLRSTVNEWNADVATGTDRQFDRQRLGGGSARGRSMRWAR